MNLVPDFARYVVGTVVDNENKPDTWDLEVLNSAIEMKLLPKDTNFVTKERTNDWDYEYLLKKLTEETINVYQEKIDRYKESGIDFTEIERMVLLRNIDTKWIDHIDSMDQLRKGISLRSYGQIDPVVEYKKEGFEMFEDLTAAIQDDTITLLLKAELQKVPPKQEERKDLQTNQTGPMLPKKSAKQEIGRNDPCPCGSGKKYKNCCGIGK